MNNPNPELVGMDAARLARIQPVLQSYVEEKGFTGISTILSRRGEIVYSGQVGHQDREAGIDLDAETIYRIYSMTKPIVCTALMMLHEEGRFQLTDPVAKFLPAFGRVQVLDADGSLVAPGRPMEVRDLLMHTSGLTYDFMEDTAVPAMYREARLMNDATRSLEDLVDVLAEMPLASHPGTRWHYSVGIDVAARLIEVISGTSLGSFLQQRLFGPLDMADTGFGVAPAKLSRLSAMYGLPDLIGEGQTVSKLVRAAVSGYNERIDVSATYPVDTPEIFARGGLGLFSTIGDYHRFAQMLMNGGQLDGRRFTSRKTLDLMHCNHLPEALLPFDLLDRSQDGWGFGLGSRVMTELAQTAGTGSVGEFGWAGAAKTYYWVDPAEELVGIMMTQYMVSPWLPEQDFRSLAYQAIMD